MKGRSLVFNARNSCQQIVGIAEPSHVHHTSCGIFSCRSPVCSYLSDRGREMRTVSQDQFGSRTQF